MRIVSYTHTAFHTLTSRLSLSVYTDVHKFTTPTRLPPVIRVTALPRAHVCHTHTVYYPTPLPRPSVSRAFPPTGFPVTPPEPGPAPSQASGFRPSGLLTPVSPGVPTGARNLGVCVLVFRLLRLPPLLCYRSLYSFVLRHPLSPRTQPLLQPFRSLAIRVPHPTLH